MVTGLPHPDELDRWRAGVARTIADSGFAHALERHLDEILHVRRSEDFSTRLTGEELRAWLRLDPSVAEIVEGHDAEGDEFAHDRFHARVREDLARAEPCADPVILEADGSPMRCLRGPFRNWGRTVEFEPAVTFVPKTKTGLCNLVKWAASAGKSVRCAGYRHTYSDLYGSSGDVLVSMLDPSVVEKIPAPEPPIDPADQLQGIQVLEEIDGGRHALCRIGAATTNNQFRNWCVDRRGGDTRWTLPLNVIMSEITIGGSNATICHGAGWRNRTLSDLVVAVEFVNARGELQEVDDPRLLKAAAGAFGVLGIVTALTIKLDRMTFAALRPERIPVPLAIPPPPGVDVRALGFTRPSDSELQRARVDFVDRCENDYYAEWFWFPFQSDCWVNTWKNDGDRKEAVAFPSNWEARVQAAEEYLAELLNESVFRVLPGKWQAQVLSITAMAALPHGKRIVTPLIDALHFQRGIQNMRVHCAEWEVPIPPRADSPESPDWTLVQKVWWAVMEAIHRVPGTPLRLPLEMRVMGGSDVIMAAQQGNRFGTCSIEVITPLNVPLDAWTQLRQAVGDACCGFSGPDGRPLNVRPHWAKEWDGVTYRGIGALEYLKDHAYAGQLPEFLDALGEIAATGGYDTQEMLSRFGNPLLRDLLG